MRVWGLAVVSILMGAGAIAAPGYRSPMEVAYSPDGKILAVSDHTAGALVLVEAAAQKVRQEVALNGQPAGVAWSADGTSVYVAERGAGTVAEVNAADGKVKRRLKVGRYPVGLAMGTSQLVVADNGTPNVHILDLASGSEVGRVPCVVRPWNVALTPDGAVAVVGNLQPFGDAREPSMAASVTLIDVPGGKKIKDIPLPSGSVTLHGVAVSPDGKWAYVLHSVGRFTLPTTQAGMDHDAWHECD